ncbi:MAG TPA: 4'-phosphopantetheinyl transferase superfamily protein [Bryobacteraceae bacterium]|jgi:4'-phosphopantetheinyl transferase
MTDLYWLEQTEADVPDENDWLAESELVSLTGMRIPKRRTDWRLGRWTAKRAVAVYLNLPGDFRSLARTEIRTAESGAPQVFLAHQPAGIGISLSHRAGTAVCALAPAGAAVGCDLEFIEHRSYAFTADYFTTEEQVLVSRASTEDRPMVIALVWSAKESALKALETGLRLDTRCVAVIPKNAVQYRHRSTVGDWRPLEVRCAGGQSFEGWWQCEGDRILTLVATPPPGLPIELKIAS